MSRVAKSFQTGELRQSSTSKAPLIVGHSQSTIKDVTGNSITTDYCTAQKTAFGDQDDFTAKGGLAGMSTALKAGMTLVLSRMSLPPYDLDAELTL